MTASPPKASRRSSGAAKLPPPCEFLRRNKRFHKNLWFYLGKIHGAAPEFLPFGCSRIPSAWVLPNSFRLCAPEFLPLGCSQSPSARHEEGIWEHPRGWNLGAAKRKAFGSSHAEGIREQAGGRKMGAPKGKENGSSQAEAKL